MTKNMTLLQKNPYPIFQKKTERQIQSMDFPIGGSKIKVVVESSVTYQNLSAENTRPMEKELAQSD